MNIKSVFYKLSDKEYVSFYDLYENGAYISKRVTDLSERTISFIINSLNEYEVLHHEYSILDVGCGKGYLLKRLHDAGFHNLTGVDLATSSLYNEIEIINGNVEDLPFDNKSFDVVLCSHTLEHVLNLTQAISELKRVARKILIITVPRQRYYHYTLDGHINFFPEKSYLLKALDITDEKTTCKNISGDWTVIIEL